MEVRRMPSSMSELYHHGIKGQEWGDRNGPPYPLDSNASVQAKKKKKSLVTRIKNKRKGKQLQKAKAAKKAEREEKARIINSGDPDKVKSISAKLTNEELNEALSRIELNSAISQYTKGGKKKIAKTGMDYINDLGNIAQNISSIAIAVGNVKNTYDRFKIDD